MPFIHRAVLPALLLALSAPGVPAQPAATAPTPLAYRSALDGYKPFADQPVGSWRDANDAVARAADGAAMPAGHDPAAMQSAASAPAPARAAARAPAPGASAKPAAAGHAGHRAP